MSVSLHVTYPLFLSDLNPLEFCRQILEQSLNVSIIKIHPVGPELFHADGKTASSRFLQRCERA